MYIDSINNRVGVGTSSPTDTLSVAGPIFLGNISAPSNSANRLYATAGDLYFAGSLIGGGTTGNWTTDGTHVWRSSGNVGIGTTTPGSILSVAGVGNFSGSGSTLYSTLTLPSLTATSSLTLSGVAINSLLSTNSSGVVTATSTPTFGNFNATSTSATSTIAGGLAIETSGFVYDYQTNRVGIGTAAPSTKLEIADATPTLTIKDTTTSISTGGTYGNLDFYSSDTNFVGVVSRIRSKTNDSNGGSDGELSFWTLAGGGSLSEKMRLTTDGKLGLGTTTPNWQLQQAATRPFHVLSDTSAGTNAKHWFTSSQGGNFYIGTSSDALNATTTLLTIANSGKVGIGTAAPSSALHVVSKATSEAGLIVTGGSTVNSHVDSGQVQIGTTVNFARLGYAAVTGTFYIDNTYNNDNSDIRFRSKIAGTAVDTLIIKGSGNLGLGTTTPQYKLQVAGVTPVLTLSDTNGGTDAKHWFQTSNAGKFSIGTTSDTFAATTTLLTLSTNGFLGVGTTTPNWQLQTASTRPFSVLSDTSAGANLKHWFTTSQGGNFYLGTSSDIYATTTVPSITITSNGLVGIASTSPSAYAILTAGGAIEGWNFIATSTTATSTFAGGLNVGNGALMYDFSQGLTSIDNLQIGATSFDTDAGILSWADMPVTSNAAAYTDESYTAQIDGNPILTVYAQSNGSGDIMNPRVGIGTTTPSYFLHLQLGDGITNATSTVLALDHISTTTAPTAGIGAGLLFRNMNAASSTIETASIIGLLSTVTAGSEDGELAFLTKSAGGALSERLRINKNGLVGVGTTTPWAKFSITATSTEVVPLFAVSTSTNSLPTL